MWNGLANLMGDDDFVSKLQSAVVEDKHFESDLTMDDLPLLVKPKKSKKKEAPTGVLTTANLAPVIMGQVSVVSGVAQASFGFECGLVKGVRL